MDDNSKPGAVAEVRSAMNYAFHQHVAALFSAFCQTPTKAPAVASPDDADARARLLAVAKTNAEFVAAVNRAKDAHDTALAALEVEPISDDLRAQINAPLKPTLVVLPAEERRADPLGEQRNPVREPQKQSDGPGNAATA
jgi:hypothetical protein